MAARLSESGKYSVAVIEAGTFYQVTDPLLATSGCRVGHCVEAATDRCAAPAGDVVFVGASAIDNKCVYQSILLDVPV